MQAELVAQFLCCIPLAGIEALLTWLKPSVPQEEQDQLLAQVGSPHPPLQAPDNLLRAPNKSIAFSDKQNVLLGSHDSDRSHFYQKDTRGGLSVASPEVETGPKRSVDCNCVQQCWCV